MQIKHNLSLWWDLFPIGVLILKALALSNRHQGVLLFDGIEK